ncbi:DUF4142 domain-containing protein [Flavobacterium sp. FlaQc-52]|jgi:predicted outer membrane protein|uniref:DUF4142 domain-containing protein n=1 Tax=Flavobacterium cupriresistens TaxID=2893885 RepID=A0ABU4R796_9FLAO|nr:MULTISPECIES: DUF4142 domain-containing protein [unclassified Flavobacterium]MDX6188423.1 DUF4142 domain-containing protein [Flavobacterium sp. Fl-318]UFH44906.1 DUF4142 domain-containing protein [Flavobacterium sp. F-323]
MKAKPDVKASILRVFFLLIMTLCISSCKESDSIETTLKNEVFIKSDKEHTEAYFLIATANIGKSIISKSQIAEQKSSQSSIREISKRIESHQNLLLEDINKMANNRLVIVTDINANNTPGLRELIDKNDVDFDEAYLNSIAKLLEQQIKLFESISKDTNDRVILKFVLQYLPENYQFLRETAQIREQIN